MHSFQTREKYNKLLFIRTIPKIFFLEFSEFFFQLPHIILPTTHEQLRKISEYYAYIQPLT